MHTHTHKTYSYHVHTHPLFFVRIIAKKLRTQRRKLKANIIIITTAIVIIFQNFRQKIILKYVTKILFDERRRKRGIEKEKNM